MSWEYLSPFTPYSGSMSVVSTEFHQMIHGEEAQVSFYAAPGRINIIGEHTDYNQGFVLPAAIDRNCKMGLSISTDKPGHFFVSEQTRKLIQKIYMGPRKVENKGQQPGESEKHRRRKKADERFQSYCQAVIIVLSKEHELPQGILATFDSDIPMGAGLSTSAAICSLLAFALNERLQLRLTGRELARVAQQAEHLNGLHCGIMDQMAVLFGKKGEAMLLDCRSLATEAVPANLKGHSWVLIHSGVSHELVDSEYNLRRDACERVVAELHRHIPTLLSLRDLEPEDLAEYQAYLNPEDFQKALYVTEENLRVLSAAEALKQGKLIELGRLMFRAHEGMREKYQISCPEIDLLVEIAATSHGVLGARMTGGGFGGCTLNLVADEAIPSFLEAVETRYSDSGQQSSAYVVQIGSGCRKIVDAHAV